MAITYKWSINQMNAHIEADGEQNVIFTVHWTYSGSEEVSGQTYQASSIGAQSFTYVKGEPFVPYADTEAFESVVIGWLDAALDTASMDASIAAQIQKQITPVNEDLYFTWQNPPIPPVPPIE
tara:strand:- start:42 stop:410 length:369 start_codon:yes stop_codon:yes gene_type:complete